MVVMFDIECTKAILSTYANQVDEWKDGHDEAQFYFDLQDRLDWGITLYKKLLNLEERLQVYAFSTKGQGEEGLNAIMPDLYQVWLKAADLCRNQAQEFRKRGYVVHGVDDLEECVEDAKGKQELMEFEKRIPRMDDLKAKASHACPLPARYND